VHVRHCPVCQTDYRPDIHNCADCGGPLEDRDDEMGFGDGEDAEEGNGEDSEEVPEGFGPLVAAGQARDLIPYADLLVEAGIECRIRDVKREGHVMGYRLLIHADDKEHALGVIESLEGEGVGTIVRGLVDAHASGGAGYAACPACETPLPEEAVECPGCGLPLREAEDVCPACGAPVSPEAPRCGNCGTPLREDA
jgi:hypothetical protein